MRRGKDSLLAWGLAFALASTTVGTLSCASGGGTAQTQPDRLATYVQRLDLAKTAYNGVVDAYTIAVEAELITVEQSRLIDRHGQAAEQALHAATDLLRVWATTQDPTQAYLLDDAFADLAAALTKLSAEWRAAKPDRWDNNL